MKQTQVLLRKTLLFFFVIALTEQSFSQQKQNTQTIQPSSFSLSLGYGTHGFTSRLDYNLSTVFESLKWKNAHTRVYVDFGIAGKTFSNPNFIFRSVSYSSDVLLLDFGAGLAEEFLFSNNHVSFTPFIGVRYEKARFTDQALINAIGTNGLIRYSGTTQVGPEINNGYGDVTTVDLGMRLGYKFNKTFEIAAHAGFSPIKYSTSGTLFGEYWGQAPYVNSYYINRSAIRAEGILRINF